MPEKMKAVVKTKKAAGAELLEVEVPKIRPNEVLIKIKATSICGTDVHIHNWDPWSQQRIHPPITVGHEFAGTVVEVGEDVEHVAVGDYVSAESHITCGMCYQCRTGQAHLCPRTQILGVDVSHRALEVAARRLRLDRLPEQRRERVTLIQSSLTYRDARIAGFDADGDQRLKLCTPRIDHVDVGVLLLKGCDYVVERGLLLAAKGSQDEDLAGVLTCFRCLLPGPRGAGADQQQQHHERRNQSEPECLLVHLPSPFHRLWTTTSSEFELCVTVFGNTLPPLQLKKGKLVPGTRIELVQTLNRSAGF